MRPSDLAVLRLIASVKVVGCSGLVAWPKTGYEAQRFGGSATCGVPGMEYQVLWTMSAAHVVTLAAKKRTFA